MAFTNQLGQPIVHEVLSADDVTEAEAKDLLFKLLGHLGLCAVRTNGTKHGNTELQLHINPMKE